MVKSIQEMIEKCPVKRFGITCSTCPQKKLCDKERKEYEQRIERV